MKRFLLFALLLSSAARADVAWLSAQEFRELGETLSRRVTLFHEVWQVDPAAELFGGTTRDFLYWLKGQFRLVANRAEAEAKMAELLALPLIDVRDFVIGESDVDIVSSIAASAISPSRFGVRKIDSIPRARFDRTTELGRSEYDQGFIPLEKIRLGAHGFIDWPGFGDGVREIYEGAPSLHVADPDTFHSTHYARLKVNHEILLALRFTRILAINYFQEHGRGFPDRAVLRGRNPEAYAAARAIVERTLASTDFDEYLQQPLFVTWLNQTVQKAFRSYTNPTAALELFRDLRLTELVAHYSQIAPINQYLFAKHRDEGRTLAAFSAFGVSARDVYRDAAQEISQLTLYHGTRSAYAFSNILLQGVLPSEKGTAGRGLYGVAKENLPFAIEWGGARERIVTFKIRPDARIIDITQGEGKRLFDAAGLPADAFADMFGADILRYPYTPPAYVVKNSAVLERPNGLERQVMTFGRFLSSARDVRTPAELEAYLQTAWLNNLTSGEIGAALERVPLFGSDSMRRRVRQLFSGHAALSAIQPEIAQLMVDLSPRAAENLFEAIASAGLVYSTESVARSVAQALVDGTDPEADARVQQFFAKEAWRYGRRGLLLEWAKRMGPAFLPMWLTGGAIGVLYLGTGHWIKHPESLLPTLTLALLVGSACQAMAGWDGAKQAFADLPAEFHTRRRRWDAIRAAVEDRCASLYAKLSTR